MISWRRQKASSQVCFLLSADSLLNSTLGLARNREQKRQHIISKHRDAAREALPRYELEAQRRQEALAKPMDTTNKGFNLLAKMGYKPGMALGKQRDDETATESDDKRLVEPIDMQLKLGRSGLGHDAMEKEQQVERCEAHMKRMLDQAKMTASLF